MEEEEKEDKKEETTPWVRSVFPEHLHPAFVALVAQPRVHHAEERNLSSVFFCSYIVGKTVHKLFKQAEDN